MDQSRMTLGRFLAQQCPQDEKGKALALLLRQVGDSCRRIADAVAGGALREMTGAADNVNVQGEEQKKLDVFANDVLIEGCNWGGTVAGMASEEEDDIYTLPEGEPRGPWLLLFDPLDGSSNIDVNVSVGTIFSVLPAPDTGRDPVNEDLLQPGHRQVAAGYAVYGPSTVLVLTLGDGVYAFTLDRGQGEWFLTSSKMKVPEQTAEFAINCSYQRIWPAPIKRYIEECLDGEEGPRGKRFNMRWIASMVADLHRIFTRGGVFLYPADEKRPNGRLRVLYEINPMSMLMEQAGGEAFTGKERALDLQPEALHQRSGLMLGSREEVEVLRRYYAEQ
ncbi:class 1 fructose-bisphosphatase [Alkalilimnicola ehrlichii MLHE-1]|uniref:Fructose-1,6-bisphosphatase class 1 n=1 Tax=Alkalilimnicola ehrlichii (strain ATCC BAA-1101 / DSM 17681 / MLHE-1) TaxID=187272 RepID=F16PA_ALKEH|nr:class 1 fructose-bisphosphatase [Alkalilimnicola ehrlichii]Q0A5B1.1 RecName: Full=Fructose-1,6-bisphosphatase class 1; Short=FBPase class 1; AltName: Full=D-fructose-1,6-bisphosphate 1-phosphohydrolase class 1 [Alkalilimnicola ehrlichii MLHE-1]ABI57976.1 D-fructose 1,6-bisphosphatase [Alkalilimnicola ehrlichii MLHE-1]